MSSKTATIQALKNKLNDIYSERNPENVAKIPYLLVKYQNQEHLLYQSVCQKYDMPVDPLTRKVKEWDAATGKNQAQIICNTTGEVLEILDDEEEEDEYDPFSTAPTEKDKLTEQSIKEIDCALLGITTSKIFEYPQPDAVDLDVTTGGEGGEEGLNSVKAVDSMGEL